MRKNIAPHELIGVPDSFEQPTPSDEHDAFQEKKDRGGGGEIGPLTSDPTQYPHLMRYVFELVKMRPTRRWWSPVEGDIRGVTQQRGVPSVYIDALVTARRGHIRKRETHKPEVNKPAFFVHSYAVSNSFDTDAVEPLRSKADVRGYIVSAGDGQSIHEMFVGTSDRSEIERIHGELSEICSAGNPPLSPRDALQKLWEKYNPPGMPATAQPYVMAIPDVQKPRNIQAGESPKKNEITEPVVHIDAGEKGGGDELVLDETPEIKPEQYYQILEQYKDYAKSQPVPSNEAIPSNRLHKEFVGMMQAGRTVDRQARYIHEFISAFPGEAFVHTRAVGEGRFPLRFEHDIRSYILSIGPSRRDVTSMRINVTATTRHLVKEIHDKVFEQIIYFSDRLDLWKDPRIVLQKVRDEYRNYNESYAERPFIEFF